MDLSQKPDLQEGLESYVDSVSSRIKGDTLTVL